MGADGVGTATIGNAIGNTGGSEAVTLTTANLPSAATTVSAGSHQHNLTLFQSGSNPWNSYIYASAATNVTQGVNGSYGNSLISYAGSHTHTISGATDTPVNIIQPSLVVNYIIKY